MPLLEWSTALTLDHPQIDQTHLEFVDLLGRTEAALTDSPEAGLAAWIALEQHTLAHFGQEDRWMLAAGLAPDNCHIRQHAGVLAVMREVAVLAQQHGDHGPLRRILPELAAWFHAHVLSMDAALASHLEQVGFDPATEAQQSATA